MKQNAVVYAHDETALAEGQVAVTIMPAIDPADMRVCYAVSPGVRISEILRLGAPHLLGVPEERIRVGVVDAKSSRVIPQGRWSRTRVRAGQRVLVRVIPAGPALLPILQLLTSVAAKAVAASVGTSLGLSAFATQLLTTVLVTAGGLLLNMLFRPKQPKSDNEESKQVYAITGWKNDAQPDAPLPMILGTTRYAPPFGATSWTEIVGDDVYIRSLFVLGYGVVDFAEVKIGETLTNEFEFVQLEFRNGIAGEGPVTLYGEQTLEESIGVELAYVPATDDYGEYVGDPVLKPITRTTADDVYAMRAIFHFPNGLFETENEGDVDPRTVTIRVEYRLADTAGAWALAADVDMTSRSQKGFFRWYGFWFPARGRYDIRCTRISPNDTDVEDVDECVWFALQSLRPEYVYNLSGFVFADGGATQIATIAARVKGTKQLNGTLDTLNLVVSGRSRTLDGGGVIGYGYSPYPADHAINILTGPFMAYPVSFAEIDLPAFEAWKSFCSVHNLQYHRVHDFDSSLDEVLRMLGTAGRAAIWHTGEKWTVTIDQVRTVPVTHISSRNASDLSWSAEYFEPPDAHRVRFMDQTRKWAESERIVPWPPDVAFNTLAEASSHAGEYGDGTTAQVVSDGGNNGYYIKIGDFDAGIWSPKTFDVTQDLELPGKTDPTEIWRETRRLQYERKYRNIKYSATQQGSVVVCAPGDYVTIALDVLSVESTTARVVRYKGPLLTLDNLMYAAAGVTYGLRWRSYSGPGDNVGTLQYTHLVPKTVSGAYKKFKIASMLSPYPPPDTLVSFGEISTGSAIECVVAGVDRGRNDTCTITMLPLANIIHTLTDAEVAPAWDSRVGTVYAPPTTPPDPPQVKSVRHGITGTGDPNGLWVWLRPTNNDVEIFGFAIRHRVGAGAWSQINYPVTSGYAPLAGHTKGQTVEWQPAAISSVGVSSVWGTSRFTTIGSLDPVTPGAPDDSLFTATAGLGRTTLAITTPSGTPNVTHIQLYWNTSGAAPTESDRIFGLIPVALGATTVRTHGDPTRTNILANSSFDAAAPPPTLGRGASVSGGALTHVALNNQVLTSSDGTTYAQQAAVNDNLWSCVAWSPTLNLFAALALSGTGTRIMTSPDGITWTVRTNPDDNNFRTVIWNPDLAMFIAVASSGTNKSVTSTDGITWTARTPPSAANYYGLAWSPSLAIAVTVGDTATTNRAASSTDGTSWTARAVPADNNWRAVAWSPSLAKFVAVASSGSNRVMESSDGTTWSSPVTDSVAAAGDWSDIAWSASLSLFVAVAFGNTNRIMTSSDGQNWTSRMTTAVTFSKVVWISDLGLFVAVATAGTDRIYTSPDGTTWTARASSFASNAWRAAAWSPSLSRLVVVGSTNFEYAEVSYWSGLTFGAAEVWRVGVDIASVSGTGDIDVVTQGSVSENWGNNWTTSGMKLASRTLTNGNTQMGLQFMTGTVGVVNSFQAYLQTATCIPQGNNHYWMRYVNNGEYGPLSSVHSVSVI